MGAKKILYGDKARQKMVKGVAKTAKAVGITMGPKGRNVALDRKFAAPLICNDFNDAIRAHAHNARCTGD